MLSALLVVTVLSSVQSPEDVAARALDAIHDGRDTEARALLADATAAIDTLPPVSHWRAWQRLGVAHLLLGSIDEARRIFTMLLDAPGNSQEIREAALAGLGRTALSAHDPTTAIRHLEQSQTKAGRQWLAVALMMESRGPSDEYVERAFTVAESARLDRPADVRRRADIAAALQPGEIMIAFLVGEQHAYAWAFDRDSFVGYPLPPSAAIAAAVDRARTYFDADDPDGVHRIAEDLMPALLGPAAERLREMKRVIFVTDGPLRRLPFAAMPLGQGRLTLEETLAVSTIDSGPLTDDVIRNAPQQRREPMQWQLLAGVAAGLLLAIAAVSRLAKRRSRAPS